MRGGASSWRLVGSCGSQPAAAERMRSASAATAPAPRDGLLAVVLDQSFPGKPLERAVQRPGRQLNAAAR